MQAPGHAHWVRHGEAAKGYEGRQETGAPLGQASVQRGGETRQQPGLTWVRPTLVYAEKLTMRRLLSGTQTPTKKGSQ